MNEESKLFGVSVRGWLAVILVTTSCTMALLSIKIEEPLYTLVVVAVTYYLGQKGQNK